MNDILKALESTRVMAILGITIGNLTGLDIMIAIGDAAAPVFNWRHVKILSEEHKSGDATALLV